MKQSKFSDFLRAIHPIAVITLCAAFLFYKYVLQIYPSIITHELMREFSLTGAGLGNLAATFYYSYLITQLFVGVLLDKYSNRWLTSAAILCCAVGVYFFASTQTLLGAELFRALTGMGVAFATVAYMKLAAVWFKPKYYAFFSGLLITAAMAGAFFGEASLSLLVGEVGWRHCLEMLGIAGFIFAILFATVVRDRPREQSLDAMHVATTNITWKQITEVLKNKQNWLLTFYAGMTFAPAVVFGGLWGNPFLQEAYHLNKAQAGVFVSIIFLGLAIGSPLLGALSNKLGSRRNLLVFCNLISTIAVLAVIYWQGMPAWLLSTSLFIFGFGIGGFMIGFALAKERNTLLLTATVMAMVNTSDALFDGATEPLIGKFLDLAWSGKMLNGVRYFSLPDYHIALSVLPVYLIIAAVLLRWVRE